MKDETLIQNSALRLTIRLLFEAKWRFALGFVVLIFCGAAGAAETLSTLDLVAEDAAFCLEVPDLNSTWTKIESGPLMDRLRDFPPYQRLLESHGFQQWQMVEEHVARQTNSTLSSQLRDLFARSLVLAIYVPVSAAPRGILIGEANDEAAVEKALATWNKLDSTEVMSTKSHHGRRYYHRKKKANSDESAYICTHDRWFAVSDHEALILDVIDRLNSLTTTTSRRIEIRSIRNDRAFAENRRKLNRDGAVNAHISARPWDRGLDESPRGPNDPIDPAAIWRHVNAVSACLRLDRGIVCDVVVELDTAHLPDGWSQFVSAASQDSSWIRRIPTDALLAFSGRVDVAPLIRHLLSLMGPHDRAELAKVRRIGESLLGGHDPLDIVLPILARDFGGFVATRTDALTKKMTLDGALCFELGSSGGEKLLQDLDHALDTGLSLLAAYQSVEGGSLVTVLREQDKTTQLRSLSETVAFPVGYGFKGSSLMVAGSRERLRQSLETLDQPRSAPRLDDHSRRFFPDANQLLWFDAALTRTILRDHSSELAGLFAPRSETEAAQMKSKLEQLRLHLGLIDSVFIASRVESDNIRIVVGAGFDSE